MNTYTRVFPCTQLGLILILLISGNLNAQVIIPAPEKLGQRTSARLYGMGNIINQLDKKLEDSNPSFDVYLDADPNNYLKLFFKFTQGSGLQPGQTDSLNIKSILYPENGDIGLFFGAFPHIKVKDKGDGEGSKWFGLYSDFLTQRRTFENEQSYSFNAVTWRMGGRVAINVDAGKNTLQYYLGAFYKSIEISDSVTDFRAIFENEKLPGLYRGTSYMLGVQWNSVNIEGEVNRFKTDTDFELRGFSGLTFNVRVSLVAMALAI